ncbi:MAPEG family protein [uncultured Methylophaga sp.]|jgi:uncharacterized MAPEG superfamily protein|uniref:MAPEG family protein n=1 Tax=uncultured Methylophaga sp. TaxID=285271 RepID=UPI002605C114|nr:MAPEG family protein [uncultured Methylophaga sp.]
MPFLFEVLFIVSLFPITLAVIGGYLRYRQFGRFDNHHPRLQQSQMSGLGARVLGAQKNAWEALIFYAVMCFLAQVSIVDVTEFSYAAGLFLLSRIAHPVFYMLDMHSYRSLVFLLGWLSCFYIGLRAVTAF